MICLCNEFSSFSTYFSTTTNNNWFLVDIYFTIKNIFSSYNVF